MYDRERANELRRVFKRFENLLSNLTASLGAQVYNSRIRKTGENGAKMEKVVASVLAKIRLLSGK